MAYGRRLLPQVVDLYAQTDPSRIYASIPNSPTTVLNGFRDISMVELAAIVNRLSWWITDILGASQLDTIAYIGPSDIRYAAVFLAGVKCGFKILFISPRNQPSQNEGMLMRTECRALLYGGDFASVAHFTTSGELDALVVKAVPSLDELLKDLDTIKHYPYDKTFDEVRDEPCLVLHSSGSTGDPKLVTMTHGTFSCTDNDRTVQVPEGRKPQNAAQFNFEGGGRFYSCFPPYHLAGVHAYIDLPIFSTSATVVFGPTKIPPSGYLLSQVLESQHIRGFYVPPYIIEQWMSEPIAAKQAQNLEFALFGGGPLPHSLGEQLSKATAVCQMYGSLEIGQVQFLIHESEPWTYMELNPFEEADMQACGDGCYELVLHQDPKLAAHRSLWHNFPEMNEWRTGDLFVPHPSKPGLWRFHSRLDDLIVFSSGYKVRPLEMETLIQGHPLVSGALIAGQGKPGPMLLLEVVPGALATHETPDAIIDQIWPMVEKANSIAPTYAKILRSRVRLARADTPFVRAPKGSIVRKLTVKDYAELIDSTYTESNTLPPETTVPGSLANSIMPGLKLFVRHHVEARLPGISITDSENVFLCGLDSIGATALSRSLQKALIVQGGPMKPGASDTRMTLRLIYINPSIEELASVVFKILTNQFIPEKSIIGDTASLQRAVAELTKGMPSRIGWTPRLEGGKSTEGRLNFALIGPRGSLGPHVLKELLKSPKVGSIYCLNRGEDGERLMKANFEDRAISHEFDDGRLSFISIDLEKPNLGLAPPDLIKITENVDVFIHNAWRVDFSWTLEFYKSTYLRSVRELVNLSFTSPRHPRIAFVSSISSVQDWAGVFPDTPVTEALPASWEVSSPLGYGQSKYVAEHVLASACELSGIPVTVLRVGQVAGPTTPSNGGGIWSTDEWIPSLAAVSKALGKIPNDIPPIDWVPVDLAARAIVELSLVETKRVSAPGSEGLGPFKVFNIVNPTLSQWSKFMRTLQQRLDRSTKHGGECCQLISLTKWVENLVLTDPTRLSEAEARSSTKILPFFQHLAETASRGIALQPKFDTTEAVKYSRTMADMDAISEGLIDGWLQQWGI